VPMLLLFEVGVFISAIYYKEGDKDHPEEVNNE